MTRRLTGHERPDMIAHYMREAVGDDLRAAQARVMAYRADVAGRGSGPREDEGSEETGADGTGSPEPPKQTSLP